MKTLIALAAVLSLASCVSSDTTVTAPDGTVTRTVTKGVDSDSVAAASAVATALSSLAVHPDK